jgi:hypothetical protein
MHEDFIEQLKQLRCGPCKNDRGIEKLAHVMWFLREDGDEEDVAILPLCLQCAKMVFSSFDEPMN